MRSTDRPAQNDLAGGLRDHVSKLEPLTAWSRLVSWWWGRRIAERVTSTMLVDYAEALGLEPFDGGFYPGPSVLVRTPAVPPSGALVLSLHDAQTRAGIVPES